MNPSEFLDLADEWAVGSREGEWRSSISRAYYAVFHVARNLFTEIGFVVPAASASHHYLYVRLNNCGEPSVIEVATILHDLREWRNVADYDLDDAVNERWAVNAVNAAMDINAILSALSANPALLARVTRAMRDFERVTLGVVTWRSP